MIVSINSQNFDEEFFHDKSLTYIARLNRTGVIFMECEISPATTIKIQKEPHSEFITVSFILDSNNRNLFEIYHCLYMDIDTIFKTITLYV